MKKLFFLLLAVVNVAFTADLTHKKLALQTANAYAAAFHCKNILSQNELIENDSFKAFLLEKRQDDENHFVEYWAVFQEIETDCDVDSEDYILSEVQIFNDEDGNVKSFVKDLDIFSSDNIPVVKELATAFIQSMELKNGVFVIESISAETGNPMRFYLQIKKDKNAETEIKPVLIRKEEIK